jgi:DNA-binding MarR family transcriptional regulator
MSEETLPAWNLVRTAHVVGLRFTELFGALDLTPTTFAILMTLAENEGLTQAELARRVLVRPQSIAALVHGLVEQGFVAREGPGGRGRRAGITLTPAGRDALDRAWPAVRAFNEPAALGLTPAQVAMLEEILDRLRGSLEAGG